MKIDRSKLKKSSTEVPADCRALIEKLKSCPEEELLSELKAVRVWTIGKCELYHWSDVLDIFDEVLERGCKKEADKKWTIACDIHGNEQLKSLILDILRFTALLIEHSFSRHLYNSMEHLTTLLSACDMTIVLGVLNLLYVFSKRSNFITRLYPEKKQALVVRLTHLAESWGGKENGFGLAECCKNSPLSSFPASSTTLHFEFYTENKEEKEKAGKKAVSNIVQNIHMDNVDESEKLPSEIMEELLDYFTIPPNKQTLLYTHIRLAHLFSKYDARVQCVQARLQAIAILVYSNSIQENLNIILYPGLIEELVDIVELKEEGLVDIKAAALRTLTSIIHLERNPKLNSIIDATGASSYHGFLPVLVRTCIQHMIDLGLDPFPQQYATALFSFLYHLASYENGVEALVSCGMMEALSKVINWYAEGQDHITFVTRAVRVIDLITNLDMAAFQAHGGLQAFINRLEHEVSICRKEQPFVIRPKNRESSVDIVPESPPTLSLMETDTHTADTVANEHGINQGASTSTGIAHVTDPENSPSKPGVQCFPQRAALLKSMLNFLKKAIPDRAFAESIRHLMDGSLPRSLKHIISNAEYYGPSLFLLATDVVTVYVFQEPSLLSSLQDSGLTDVVLHALLKKDVPATREVLASLPNMFSALCLNTRGLQAFVDCDPFDRLLKVLLSPDYLPAMRRRSRSSDPFGDTASNLGNAMDELMRHQPTLRSHATMAIIKLLEKVGEMGRDSKYICYKQPTKLDLNINMSVRSPQPTDGGSSDEEEEEEELASQATTTSNKPDTLSTDSMQTTETPEEKQAIPLTDYVLNVMRFVEAILSNNSTDDHCREFVTHFGVTPLLRILGLPNLPIDFPASPACQAVATVCKAILTLSREPQVLKQGLIQLNEVLDSLKPLHKHLDPPGGSVLLRELAGVSGSVDPTLSPQATPLLHALSAAHAYIMMFVHVCRLGQNDIRTISVSHWGSELGLEVLEGLSQLYTSLVWESTVLLALCSEDILPPGCDFGRADIDKILPKDVKGEKDLKEGEETLSHSSGEMGSNGVSVAMESLSTSENPEIPMDVSEPLISDKDAKKSKLSPILQAQIKQLKPLLSVSSRLGRSLAELFGLLVKLCVGTPLRHRRSHQLPPTPTAPTPAAQSVAKALTKLLANGLSWTPPSYAPVPKLRLTFLVCSVGFTSPMLFDEKKQPYHLMLQKFVSSGGQDSLFQAFSWALSMDGKVPLTAGIEHSDLPDGSGEFLDAWLMLVEKMVNPKTILESVHILPVKSNQPTFTPFSHVQYLISTQKAAFNAVMNLWGKQPLKIYGSRMSESILAILCHIIKGETIIKEALAKEKEEKPETSADPSTPATTVATTSANSGTRRLLPDTDLYTPQNIQQLMDMGFTREHCAEALMHSVSLEQATEYILSHPPPVVPPTVMQASNPETSNPSTSGDNNEELTEHDQVMQAIAMSLGQDVVMSTDQKTESEEKKQEIEEPLDKSVLDNFTENILPGCMSLLDTLPETVYRVCDLLVVVTNRNGEQWRQSMLKSLVLQICELGEKLCSQMSVIEDIDKSNESSDSAKFATRLHVLSLLFEEMMMPCATAFVDSKLIELLIKVLNTGQEYLVNSKEKITPKWMAPLLLLIDLFEKVSITSYRTSKAAQIMSGSHSWKWFDDGSGRWCKYSQVNNKTIDDSYQNGDSSIRFQAGRRRYTVQFNSMVQVNEETGNRRPIMLSLPSDDKSILKHKDDKDSDKTSSASNKDENNSMETECVESERYKEKNIVEGLNDDLMETVIRCVVALMRVPVDPDTLHASLRLTLRLTRSHKFATLFSSLGGSKLLLGLTQESLFQGFVSLATLLFRHILEEPMSLKYCMEKVLRCACAGIGSSVSGVTQGSIGSKEMNYVLRVLGPAACRNPEYFVKVCKSTLRIALPPAAKIVRDEDEVRYCGPNAPQIVKCIPSKQVAVIVSQTARDVIYELLNALIVKYMWNKEDSVSTSCEVRPAQTLAEAIQDVVNEVARELNDQRQSQTESASEDESNKEIKDTNSKVNDDNKKKRPLLPKSSILRLLSEFIKSYGNSSQLITQYKYATGQSELITEDCTVLAFILDQLLPQCQVSGDKDCPALSRVIIASLASCNHCPEAQNSLVSEIKAALQRALILPESSQKHSRVQALTGIISTMIESCPSPGNIPNQVFKGQQTILNNMVKILIKRGMVADLARIPHCLDLSSPYMANTINSALKPLETLSRSVNQSMQNPVGKAKTSTSSSTSVTSTATGSTQTTTDGTGTCVAIQTVPTEIVNDSTQGTSNIDTTVAIEDVSEDPLATEDLEETDIHTTVEPELDSLAQAEAELEQVLDEILRNNDNPEDEVIEEISMVTDDEPVRVSGSGEDNPDVMINVEIVTEDDDDHDSQMVTQDISDGEEDVTIEHEQDMDIFETSSTSSSDSRSSDSSSNSRSDMSFDEEFRGGSADIHEEDQSSASDDDDDDDNDDQDDNDDDEEEHDHDDDEEDDEGSDMEADDDDYQEVDNSVAPGIDDDFLLHMDDMFPANTGSGNQHIIFNTDNSQFRTYQLPSLIHDNDNGNESTVPSLPPAPGNVPVAHPLLIRNNDPSLMGVTRVHRGGNRQRGSYRFNANTQTIHVNLPTNNTARQPNPPVILQRLLGPTTAADILQLTNTLTTQTSGPTHTRVVLANDDRCIISRQEEDIFDELFQDPYPESGAAGTGALSCIPSTLTRWTEESKVLDSDSVHDCVNIVKPEIIDYMMKCRDADLVQRRKARQKAAEEEAVKKEKEKQEKQNDVNAPIPEATSSTTENSDGSSVDILQGNNVSSGILTPPTSTPTSITAIDNTGTQISVSEAVAAVERLASVVVEEVLASPITTTTTTTTTSSVATPSITCSTTSTTFSTPTSTTTVTSSIIPTSTNRFLTPSIHHPTPIPPDAPRRNEGGGSNQTNLAFLLSFDEVESNSMSAGSSTDPPSFTGGQSTIVSTASSSSDSSASTISTDTTTTAALSTVLTANNIVNTVPSASTDSSLPDGVDPSFLAALPENIRQEVIAEQLRLQRIQQRAQLQAQAAESSGTMEVNPEFLAALPLAIQEEVLAQQRAEQARAAAQTQSQTNPETPIDPAGFFATLPSQLRQQVLSDMDESMIAVLPTDLAAEAQELRRELEDRHRRLIQERLFAQAGAASLSAILRHTGLASRIGTRYAIRAPRFGNHLSTWGSGRMSQQNAANANNMKLKGRHLLDHESLTCLLVLLFLDEPKLNTSRLHRVLRNLCYHGATRAWVIRALLSILQKTSDCKLDNEDKAKTPSKQRKISAMQTDSPSSISRSERNHVSWLNISQEAALGCRANVFQIQRSGKKHTNTSNTSVNIHSQAAPVVCRHVLDTLISLAKIFPGHFLPSTSANDDNKVKEVQKCEEDKDSEIKSKASGSGGTVSPRLSKSDKSDKTETDFWDLLVRLDSASGKKGKGIPKLHSSLTSDVEIVSSSYNTSPIGQLMAFLSHSVIRRSQLLTDRLLRLLGLVSIGLPESARNRSTGNTTTPLSIFTPSTSSNTTATASNISSQSTSEKLIERNDDIKEIKIEDDKPILETELQLAVQVLTSKSCSEEGLEDATNLLLQLSWATPATRNSVLNLLLQGARELGLTVSTHIRCLLHELQEMNCKLKDDDDDDDNREDVVLTQQSKGVLVDRFAPGNNIIVAAPTKFKTGRELQLPSMSQLTSKVSSQQFFLRVLKVIIQLREAARVANKNTPKPTTSATYDRLQDEVDSLLSRYDSDLFGVQGRSLNTAPPPTTTTSDTTSSASNTIPTTTDQTADTPMDVDQAGPSQDKKEKKEEKNILPRLSDQLALDDLWSMLGDCLTELAKTPDQHAVLILQSAVEAFFIVHAGEKESKTSEASNQKREDQMAHLNLEMAPPSPGTSDSQLLSRENSVAAVSSLNHLPPDTQKFLRFAETHRTVLNQILRQSTTPLADGPFSVLVDHTRILDFDVKRRYFRQELEQHDEGLRREDLPVHVRREHVFEDSFRELFRRSPEEWKQRFYIVFEGEEGQDAGGLLREWYLIISREIFNPNYALFRTSPGDRVTYTINPSSHCNSNHLSYFKFVGRIIAKAVYDNKLLECYFTRSFYKHLLGLQVRYTDMESEDYSFYSGLVFLLENTVDKLGYELSFNTEIQEFGVTESRDLKPNGRNIPVTEENKREYVKLVCQMRMTADIRKQLNAFLEGFYDIIPKKLVSIFTEQEIELLISGLPTIDIDDLKANSEYHKYQATSLQIQWFWRALRSFDQAERANFLQFVTGTSKVPLQGFAFLEGMNGIQKFQIHRDDRSTDRLPTAHTCFNQLDLPAYETYDKLRHQLLLAVSECSEGFGLA